MDREFRDRTEAGRILAGRLGSHYGDARAIVLALPRGGVPVGFEIATALGLPLDILIVRKLGVPGGREIAMGAIAEGGACVLNQHVIEGMGVPGDAVAEVEEEEREELERRGAAYRAGRPPASLEGKTVILVDDGLATGATMRVAVMAARQRGATRVIVAIPVAPPETCDLLRTEADEVICLLTPFDLVSVGTWYRDFTQTSDEEVVEYLGRAGSLHGPEGKRESGWKDP